MATGEVEHGAAFHRRSRAKLVPILPRLDYRLKRKAWLRAALNSHSAPDTATCRSWSRRVQHATGKCRVNCRVLCRVLGPTRQVLDQRCLSGLSSGESPGGI